MGIMLKEERDAFPKFEILRCPTCGERYDGRFWSKCDACGTELERVPTTNQEDDLE